MGVWWVLVAIEASRSDTRDGLHGRASGGVEHHERDKESMLRGR